MRPGTAPPSSPVNTPEALDRELEATLGGAPVPRLSPQFEARLAARLVTGEDAPGRTRRSQLATLLPAYWLFVAVATGAILAGVDWTAVPRAGIWSMTVAAVSVVLPSVVLAWQARAALR